MRCCISHYKYTYEPILTIKCPSCVLKSKMVQMKGLIISGAISQKIEIAGKDPKITTIQFKVVSTPVISSPRIFEQIHKY